MPNKNFITALFFLLLSLTTVKADKSNVLLIAVDDMNDWIGSLNNNVKVKTPNIDKLAERGVNFSNAHTPGVYCAPSRSSIFTGQYASTTGIYQYQVYHATHPHLTPMQVSFQKAGYNTYGTGKLFHHSEGQIDLRGWTEFRVRTERQRKTGWPLDSLSDEMRLPPQEKQIKANKILYSKNGQKKWGVITDERETEMADTIRADWTIAKLQGKHNKPFFIGMGLYAPHIPNYNPQKYYDMYDKNNIPRPELKADDLDDLPEPLKTERMKRKKSAHDPLKSML